MSVIWGVKGLRIGLYVVQTGLFQSKPVHIFVSSGVLSARKEKTVNITCFNTAYNTFHANTKYFTEVAFINRKEG